jgi:hypothetical protein
MPGRRRLHAGIVLRRAAVLCAVVLACAIGPVALGPLARLAPAAPAGAAAAAPPDLDAVVVASPGPGYGVTRQGPLSPQQFASDAPDPAATEGALSTLGASPGAYQRAWQADGGLHRVQDLVVRFPSAARASAFVQAAQRSLHSGEIVSTGPLTSVPGARLVSYYGSAEGTGVGEAVTMRSGAYISLLLFFSTAATTSQPIAPADAGTVARAQYDAIVSASGDHTRSVPVRTAQTARKSASSGEIGWAILAVAIMALAVATPRALRRRRQRRSGVPAGRSAEPAPQR